MPKLQLTNIRVLEIISYFQKFYNSLQQFVKVFHSCKCDKCYIIIVTSNWSENFTKIFSSKELEF